MTIKNTLLPWCLVVGFVCTLNFSMACKAADDAVDFQQLIQDPSFESFVDNETFELPTRSISNQDVAITLVQINAIPLLLEPFYLRTNPLNSRSLLDYPIFLPQYRHKCGWTVGGDLFWNQTTKMFVGQHTTNLDTYLAVCQESLLNALSNSVTEVEAIIGKPFNFKIGELLPLLRNIYFQERRLGVMFHAEGLYPCVGARVQILAPLYYGERNYFMDLKDQQAMQATVKDALGQESSEEGTQTFALAHLVGDKVGLGDTRIMVDFQVLGTPKFCTRIGGLVTLPTAFSMRNGVMGTYFESQGGRPVLDLANMINLGLSGSTSDIKKAEEQAEAFLLGVLDRLSSNMINMPLGHKKHFGIGGLFESDSPLYPFIPRPWAENINLNSFISLEYLLPRTEQRYFIQTQDSKVAAFAAHDLLRPKKAITDQMAIDEDYADSSLEFMETAFSQMFYPFLYKVKVMPGIVFRWASKAGYDSKRWGFFVGSDLWIQGPEKLVMTGLPSCLDCARAIMPLAYQGQLFGSIYFKIPRPCNEWSIGINIADTFTTSGIGQDFTVALNLETTF